MFSFSFIFYLTLLFSFNYFFLSAVLLFKEKKIIFTSKVNVCRVVSSSARTKRNNAFPTACPASDSFDIGFVSSGNGWWWAPELTLLSGFTPFYFLLHVPSFFCSQFSITYFYSNEFLVLEKMKHVRQLTTTTSLMEHNSKRILVGNVPLLLLIP